MPLPSDRRALLQRLRWQRGFVAGEVLDAKVGRVRRWFAEQALDAAVVGVSGGVDSAVALGLLARVAAEPGSPVRRVVAALVPVDAPGATGQQRSLERGRLVAGAFDGVEVWELPVAEAQHATVLALEKGSGLPIDDWAAGQLLSVLRTPVLYGAAALLQAHGHRSLVVGTTNRDEGAYLGFFGKASDGMVDLQPLSDLHKSEVRALAVELGVPDVVVGAAPTGDVWDGSTDEELIGAGYDDVELVLRLRELGVDPSAVAADLADGDELLDAVEAVERLHRHNAHKYRVGSPAVHLDVLPRGVPGGWPDEALTPRGERRPAGGTGPGEWAPPAGLLEPAPTRSTVPAVVRAGARAAAPRPDTPENPDNPDGAFAVLALDVLTAEECDVLARAMTEHSSPAPVGVTGVAASPGVGSMRATAWSHELAGALWTRIRTAVPSVRFLGPTTPTDGWDDGTRAGHRTWRAVGLSPVLRFMRYDAGGRHLCHFDAGYDYGDGRRTLLSVVLYLTGARPGDGGATRFVGAGEDHLPVWERTHDDWARDTRPDEVLAAVPPRRGAALVFDHRLGHDVERWAGADPRIVIRADVVYEAVPDGRTLP